MSEQEPKTTGQQEEKLSLPKAAIPKIAHALFALNQELGGEVPYYIRHFHSPEVLHHHEDFPRDRFMEILAEAGVVFEKPQKEGTGNE